LVAAQARGEIEVVAIWSHLANADAPLSDPLSASVRQQRAVLEQAIEIAQSSGLRDSRWHLANSAATLQHPDTHGSLVRVGIAMYGVSPFAERGVEELGLIPAMTLRAGIALVKQIQPGTGVSYGSTWTAEEATTLALVPLGYADGIPRAASGRAWVGLGDSAGTALPTVGRIAMDQFVVAVPPGVPVEAGDWVSIFGDPRHGAPTAEEWARASGSIGYEIVTRIGSRVPRTYPARGMER
jgi:alanine racemase